MMLGKRSFLLGASAAVGGVALAAFGKGQGGHAQANEAFEVTKTPAQWRAELTEAQYEVLREADTERPGSSPLNKETRAGIYACAGCDLPVYSSKAKFESGTGWPSFTTPIRGAVRTKPDPGLFGTRTEAHCRRCGGHLGHVFDDGPRPTGQRWCMNGVAMDFHPGKQA